MRNKVLHVWNTAGIAGLLARYIDGFGWESEVIARKVYDPFGLATEKVILKDSGAYRFALEVGWKAKDFDIIHIHSAINVFKALKLALPNKKFILHFHGSDLRLKYEIQETLIKADMVLVSTPDLLEYFDGARYLPNPVNEQVCDSAKVWMKDFPKIWGAFHVENWAKDKAEEYAQLHDLPLETFNKRDEKIKHDRFLTILAKYQYYISVERDINPNSAWKWLKGTQWYREPKIIESLSLTALEALYMGCKVIDWKGKVRHSFPKKHRSDNVGRNLAKIYREVIY